VWKPGESKSSRWRASVPDLKRKLIRYVCHYNKDPKTVKRKYFDPDTPQTIGDNSSTIGDKNAT
jgi:hypothetical protein